MWRECMHAWCVESTLERVVDNILLSFGARYRGHVLSRDRREASHLDGHNICWVVRMKVSPVF